MGFAKDLQSGSRGLKFAIPKTFKTADEFPISIRLDDSKHYVSWSIFHLPFMLDLQRDYDSLLQSDIRRCARSEFLDYQEANHKDNKNPRADDPEWSSVIEVEYVEVGSAPALYVLRRLSYHRGDEIILGHIMIPVADGTFDFRAACRAAQTGMRESVLMIQKLKELQADTPGVTMQEASQHVPMEYMDDPKHDSVFEGHPLTLVRAACRWLRDKDGAGIKVTAPMDQTRSGEFELPKLDCAIVPPPRYIYSPGVSQTMGDSMAVFTRTAIASSEHRLHLGVWRIPQSQVKGANRQDQLVAGAESTIKGWEREGASDIKIETTRLPDEDGRARVATYTEFKVGNTLTQAVAIWLADTDGSVFRIEVGAPPYVSKEEMQAELDMAFPTWRRLSGGNSNPKLQ